MNAYDKIELILQEDQRYKQLKVKFNENQLNGDHADYDEDIEAIFYKRLTALYQTILTELFFTN